MRVLLRNLFYLLQCSNFENWLRFDEVTATSLVASFLLAHGVRSYVDSVKLK